MTYTIETGVPIPKTTANRPRSELFLALEKMKPGESILVTNLTAKHVHGTMPNVRQRLGGKYTVRAMPDGIRIWRTE